MPQIPLNQKMPSKIWKIKNFEKIITEISNLKSQNLRLGELILLVENLVKILKLQQKLENKKENPEIETVDQTDQNSNLAIARINLENSLEKNLENSLKIGLENELENQKKLSELLTKLTLFVSSYDFLLWSLQPHLVQNKFELTKAKSNQKPILKKWTNLLQVFGEIYADLAKLVELEIPEKSQNLQILLTHKILQIGQNLNQINLSQNCLLEVQKNFLEAKIAKSNFTLENHFESILSNLEATDHLCFETNLEEIQFWELIKICKLENFLAKNKRRIVVETLEIKNLMSKSEDELANLAEISMNKTTKKIDATKLKDLESEKLEGSQLESIKRKNLESKLENETLFAGNQEVENNFAKFGNRTKSEFLVSVNLELFLAEKMELVQETGQNIGILCGQNSTLNDASLIATTKLNPNNWLILGESGSLTKIISKLDQKNSQLVILRNNNFLHLSSHFVQKSQNKPNLPEKNWQNLSKFNFKKVKNRNSSKIETFWKQSKKQNKKFDSKSETKNLKQKSWQNTVNLFQNQQNTNQKKQNINWQNNSNSKITKKENWQKYILKTSKTSQKIVKWQNLEYQNLSKIKNLSKNLVQNKFSEIWFIGQPYLALDNFWEIENGQTLKKLHWQSQINLLSSQNSGCKIGVIRTFWK